MSMMSFQPNACAPKPAPLQCGTLVGSSPASYRLFEDVKQFAQTNYPVLITGESGTGKELVANTLHRLSSRKNRAFVPINCACLSPSVAESELFGHMRGAFTGADRSRRGAFATAHKGTLFLDEFAELSPRVQASLLRALETGEVRSVGSDQPTIADVRLICATNASLWDKVQRGDFRSDLMFRVNVLHITIPPLRARLSDIDVLAPHLLSQLPERHTITKRAIACLKAHHWPGNVRELRNVLTRSAVRSGRGGVIDAEHIQISKGYGPDQLRESLTPLNYTRQAYDHVSRCLQQNGGNRKLTYQSLGIPRSTFYRWLREGKVLDGNGERPHPTMAFEE